MDFQFRVRAERSAQGDGRTYTVTYTATDDCGNETTTSAEVFVPHDRSGKSEPMGPSVAPPRGAR